MSGLIPESKGEMERKDGERASGGIEHAPLALRVRALYPNRPCDKAVDSYTTFSKTSAAVSQAFSMDSSR